MPPGVVLECCGICIAIVREMRRAVAQNLNLHGNVPNHCSAALLLVDVLNDLDFPGSKPLVTMARTLGKNIAALKLRCRQAGVPSIYVNDNSGQWRSDSRLVIDNCLRP